MNMRMRLKNLNPMGLEIIKEDDDSESKILPKSDSLSSLFIRNQDGPTLKT